MLEEIPSSTWWEWIAFFGLEPFGCEVDNWRAGMIAATIANAAPSKRRRTFKPKDFMPQRKRPQTWQEQLKIVEELNAAFGGKDLRRR